MPRALDESEHRFIAEAIRNGGKRNELARRFGRSPSVISKIAAAEGIEFERSQTKKASEAKRSYAQYERLKLLNKSLDKARDILPDIQEPRDFKALVVAVGTLIDKRRLEEGKGD